MNKRLMLAAAISVSVAACSAIGVKGNAANVVLASAQPTASCRYMGEALGSQGNWFTGDYTANAKLMQGARNDLRNKAAAMGGNYVWVQNQSNAHAHGSLGTDNTTVVGNVYACGTTSDTATLGLPPSQHGLGSGAGPAPIVAATRGTAAQVLHAQEIAKSQDCGDVSDYGDGEYAASCSAGTLIIRCQGGACQPVQMKH